MINDMIKRTRGGGGRQRHTERGREIQRAIQRTRAIAKTFEGRERYLNSIFELLPFKKHDVKPFIILQFAIYSQSE